MQQHIIARQLYTNSMLNTLRIFQCTAALFCTLYPLPFKMPKPARRKGEDLTE